MAGAGGGLFLVECVEAMQEGGVDALSRTVLLAGSRAQLLMVLLPL